MTKVKPGWTWLYNATKWHYFGADGKSLCRRWLVFRNDDASQEDTPSPDNCVACWRKRQAALAKAAA